MNKAMCICVELKINLTNKEMITEKDIIEAYARIRTIDNTIPDNVLDFMKNAAIEQLRLCGVSKPLCEECKQPLPEGMKHRCYDCYDAIYCPK